MRLTILAIITALGVTIPLLWLAGTLASVVYFARHRLKADCQEGVLALTPELGLTMADGGDAIEKKEKE